RGQGSHGPCFSDSVQRIFLTYCRQLSKHICQHNIVPQGSTPMRCKLSLILISLLAAFGCGKDASGRQALSGTVTLSGQRIEQGSIQFVSIESGNPWRAGAEIEDGAYEIPQEKGLPPGSYRVMISSAAPQTEQLSPEQLGKQSGVRSVALPEERIPA